MGTEHDDIQHSIETGIQGLVSSLDERVRSLVDELWQATQKEREHAVEALRAEAGERERSSKALQAELERLRGELTGRESDLAGRDKELEKLRAELASRESDLADRDKELEKLRAELASRESDLSGRDTELERLRGELAERAADLAGRDTELGRLRSDLTTRDADLASREAALAGLRDQLAAAAVEREEATTIADVSRRVVGWIRRLDEARSLTEVLDTLADALRDEAPRTALLVMKGTHAEAWRLSGFGSGIDSKQVQLGARMSGVFGRAASVGETTFERADGDSDSTISGLPFAELPTGYGALAVPLVIGGRIAAVVYADDAGDPVDGDEEGWPGIIEVIARHGGRCLEALTAQRARRTPMAG